MTIGQVLQSAVEHHRAGRLAEAEKIYRQILAQQPRHAYALHLLGLLANQTGHPAQALELVRQAVAAKPDELEFHSNLAVILLQQQRFAEAADALGQALALKPDWPEGRNNLAVARINLLQFEQAADELRKAVTIKPQYAEAHANLGNVLRLLNRPDESAAAYRAALSIRADMPGARDSLALVLRMADRPDEAILEYQTALARDERSANLHCGLANAHSDAGERAEAQRELHRAMELAPGDAKIGSNFLFLLQYQPGVTADQILREHRRWDEHHARPLRNQLIPHSHDRDPERRLRIGYVSPDFREHVLAHFLVPLFASHDHERFEITCYAELAREDAVSQRIRSGADRWQRIEKLDDQRLAEMIRADGIDVLVDLTMHMTRSRLLAFAREPAPVQITWLAYPGTTGLSTMHYRLTDPYLDPPGSEAGRYSEESIRLADTFWCYDPLSDEPRSDPPAARNGFVTFGCLNNFCKVTDDALDLWADVMREVTGSRLILMAPLGSARQRVLDRLARGGVDADRVEFVGFQPRAEYLKTYHRIDVALDTIPYNGHTTSLDAMWMGVPVVTRVGQTVVGRAGLSQLSNLSLSELAAPDDERFVRIAVELAGDSARLSQLRSALRERMLASPLADAPRFARNIESAYRTAWRRWCSAQRSEAAG